MTQYRSRPSQLKIADVTLVMTAAAFFFVLFTLAEVKDVKEFELESIPKDMEAFLCFDGVTYRSEVYLNGHTVRIGFCGYSKFNFLMVSPKNQISNPEPKPRSLLVIVKRLCFLLYRKTYCTNTLNKNTASETPGEFLT